MNCANHPEVERAAFCQNCGKPLCRECMRPVGAAIYCEPCLEAKISAANAASAGAAYSYSGTTPQAASYSANAAAPTPPPGAPSPVLAGLLGLIPGVGAMYNGQFVKALVHLVIFGVLVSLADQAPFFGILITGWVFYQVFDAFQTAKARLEGTPLPDPFGFNNLGDRLGWTHNGSQPVAGPVVGGAPVGAAPPAAGYTPPSAAYAVPPASAPYASSYTAAFTGAPGTTSTASAMPTMPPPPLDTGSTLPTGALVLIGLGVFFLLGSLHIFNERWLGQGWPFLLIGLGIWLFVRRMQVSTYGLMDDGSAAHRWYTIRTLRGPSYLILTGFLFLMDKWNVLSFGKGWPLYLILAGVLHLAERAAFSNMQAEGHLVPPMPGQPPVVPADPGSSIVPAANTHDEEGS